MSHTACRKCGDFVVAEYLVQVDDAKAFWLCKSCIDILERASLVELKFDDCPFIYNAIKPKIKVNWTEEGF